MCRSSVSFNSTFHEHTTSIIELRRRRLASCPRRMTTAMARCEASPLLRAATLISRITLSEGWLQCSRTLQCGASWHSPPPGRPLVLVDLPPPGVVRTPHVARKTLEPAWKGGPSDGAVARLLGIFWPNMLDRSRTRQRVARRAPSRNENRGALPKVPSIIKYPFASGFRCHFDRPRPSPL